MILNPFRWRARSAALTMGYRVANSRTMSWDMYRALRKLSTAPTTRETKLRTMATADPITIDPPHTLTKQNPDAKTSGVMGTNMRLVTTNNPKKDTDAAKGWSVIHRNEALIHSWTFPKKIRSTMT
jgi:hypothetical protein